MNELETHAFSLALEQLEAIPFFPRGEGSEGAQIAILEALMRFVAGPQELQWLIRTAVDNMRKWEGVAELRALYATRWKPMDGLPVTPCQIPGFTESDSEARWATEQAAQKYLPAPNDTPNDAGKAEIDNLAEKMKLQAGSLRPKRIQANPEYLENL